MSSKDKNEKKKENEDEDDYENGDENDYDNDDDDYDDETMDQNKNKNKKVKDLNDILDEIIDKSKSFEEQIKSLKKREDLKGFWTYNDFGDKELKSKYFKIELADMSNEIDKKLFEQIFGHTLIKSVIKLIYTKNKEENKIIVKNINENKEKLYKQDDYYNFVFQPSDRCINLIDAIRLILDFNEELN